MQPYRALRQVALVVVAMATRAACSGPQVRAAQAFDAASTGSGETNVAQPGQLLSPPQDDPTAGRATRHRYWTDQTWPNERLPCQELLRAGHDASTRCTSLYASRRTAAVPGQGT